MKFQTKTIDENDNILANDHYVAQSYDCSTLTSLAVDGVIKAGTFIPDSSSPIGVLLNDVILNENPNGTVVIHGFIKKSKLSSVPDESVNLPMITFLD